MPELIKDEENEFNQLRAVWKAQIENRTPIMVIGQTGVGKTSIFSEIAKEMGRDIMVSHFARCSNTDLLIPYIDTVAGITKYAVNENIKQLEKGNYIWLIDEYDRADGMMRNAILSVINERILDGMKIPDSVGIVLCGNQEYSRDTNLVNQAELSRCSVYRIDISHLTGESDYLQYWTNQATNKLNIDTRVISYIVNQPEYLYKEGQENEQFATPRSWENLSKNLSVIDNVKRREIRYKLITSFIGNEAGERFLTYIDVYSKMPTAKQILENFDECNINTFDKKIATTDILLNYIAQKKEDIKKAIKLIHEKLNDELLYSFILMAKDRKDLTKELYKTAEKDKELMDILGNIAFYDILSRTRN